MNNLIKFKYGQTFLNVKVQYSERKTLAISVYPDCSVLVSSPKFVSKEVILGKLNKRAQWIKKQLNFFKQFLPRTPERKYIGGESHLYLGRHYRLKIIDSDTENVKVDDEFILISLKNYSSLKTKHLLNEWYETNARVIFEKRLKYCLKKFPNYKKPKLVIRKLKKSWGNMRGKNILTLNKNLIKAPVECIDYVIIHELCHVQFPNHSSEFWSLLNKKIPIWKKLKHKLEISLN